MKLYVKYGWKEFVYDIKEIHFQIDENGIPVDIEIIADKETYDSIAMDLGINTTFNCNGEETIFVGRFPTFELK